MPGANAEFRGQPWEYFGSYHYSEGVVHPAGSGVAWSGAGVGGRLFSGWSAVAINLKHTDRSSFTYIDFRTDGEHGACLLTPQQWSYFQRERDSGGSFDCDATVQSLTGFFRIHPSGNDATTWYLVVTTGDRRVPNLSIDLGTSRPGPTRLFRGWSSHSWDIVGAQPLLLRFETNADKGTYLLRGRDYEEFLRGASEGRQFSCDTLIDAQRGCFRWSGGRAMIYIVALASTAENPTLSTWGESELGSLPDSGAAPSSSFSSSVPSSSKWMEGLSGPSGLGSVGYGTAGSNSAGSASTGAGLNNSNFPK